MNSVIQILMTVSPGIYLIPSLHLVSLPYSHVLFINLHFVCHIQLSGTYALITSVLNYFLKCFAIMILIPSILLVCFFECCLHSKFFGRTIQLHWLQTESYKCGPSPCEVKKVHKWSMDYGKMLCRVLRGQRWMCKVRGSSKVRESSFTGWVAFCYSTFSSFGGGIRQT